MGSPFVEESAAPPFNEGAEQAVLAALLLESDDVAPVVQPLVRPEDFYGKGHALLYRAMLSLAERGTTVDPLTLADELQSRGDLAGAGGKDYIGFLIDAVPTHLNAEHHAKLVRQYAEARRLLTTLERETLALRQPGVKPDEVAARVADAVLGVQLLGQAGFVDAHEVVGELSKDLYERLENPGGIFGVPMGFREIDERIGGKREGELTIIAGVPGSGKTALGFQVALHNAVERKDRNAVAFVSAEMPKKDLFERGVCNLARLETHRVRRMMIQDEEITRLGRALETLKHAPLYTDDTPTPNVADVLARCRSLKMRHPEIKLIVVDFLQLLGGLDDENRAEELRAVSYALKGMAKLLKVHVIALAQLNDKVVEARSDKRPQLGDLQGSSGMRQAADWIALCYRPKMYDPALAEDIVEVNYAKCRGVATFTTDLNAQLQFMRLTDKPTPAGVIARAEWVHA